VSDSGLTYTLQTSLVTRRDVLENIPAEGEIKRSRLIDRLFCLCRADVIWYNRQIGRMDTIVHRLVSDGKIIKPKSGCYRRAT
jgi:hypothetical protein